MTQALFVREGDAFVPTRLSGSPWSPDLLHGGPPTGLLAYALERAADTVNLRLTRLTVDLLRPVPSAPLTVRVETVRSGRRLQLLTAALLADGVEVSRATALFLERREVTVPDYGRFPTETLPSPEGRPVSTLAELSGMNKADKHRLPGLHTTAEACLIDGTGGRGAGRVWMRLPVPVVAGEPVSPTVQAATLCDFGNGVGQLRLAPDVGTINADISLHLHRTPAPGWLGLDARSRMQPDGVGLAETVLYDELGSVGRVTQTTLAMPVYKAST